ncbi:MAG TPA: SET domain-containing protein [Xanthobacteraceae bacterium]
MTDLIRNKRTRVPHQTGPFRVARSRTGLGLFATEPIRKGKFIIEYWGQRVRWRDVEDEDQNRYYFDLNTRWAIDGADRRNTARYINHSCKPNAEPYEMRGKIKIYARRGIKPGEEITYDYGKEYFEQFLEPVGCKCAGCANGHGRSNRRSKASSKVSSKAQSKPPSKPRRKP